MVIDEIVSYLRNVYLFERYSTRLSLHEGVKAQLYVLGFKLHLQPIMEARVGIGMKRVDCLFLDKENNPVCAIEIDGSIKLNSIKKLRSLPDAVEKIVISTGKLGAHQKAYYRNKQLLTNINLFHIQSKSIIKR